MIAIDTTQEQIWEEQRGRKSMETPAISKLFLLREKQVIATLLKVQESSSPCFADDAQRRSCCPVWEKPSAWLWCARRGVWPLDVPSKGCTLVLFALHCLVIIIIFYLFFRDTILETLWYVCLHWVISFFLFIYIFSSMNLILELLLRCLKPPEMIRVKNIKHDQDLEWNFLNEFSKSISNLK